MKYLKKFNQINELSILSAKPKVAFTKQTMKLNVDWRTAKDFEIYYKYRWMSDYRISNDENGCNFPNGYDSQLADTTKLNYLSKNDINSLYKYANEEGGSPKPAFIVKKDTKINIIVEEYQLIIEILDGIYAGKKFSAQLVDFRTCVVGEAKDENLVVSKYKIFLNGKPLKAKYYQNMGRIKLALLNAFGFQKNDDEEEVVPYYISDCNSTTLSKNDCKNVQIMRYDNNSKNGIPVDFNVLEYYNDYLIKKDIKKDIKKYNL